MLNGCVWWIFDMDGTLTVPAHDFDAMRAHLGIDRGPILEAIEGMEPARAAWAHRELDAWERGLAQQAQAQDDARRLLEALRAQGRTLGVLTRNSVEHAHLTLQASGLGGFFHPDNVLGRDSAAPKPAPDGVLALLRRWSADPHKTVMVGDYLHDSRAGRAAGVRTALVVRREGVDWAHEADVIVRDLGALLE